MKLLVRNRNDIVIRRMRLASDGTAVSDAILTAVIYDPNDQVIDTVTLSHSSSGTYRGSTVAQITAGVEYKIVVTSTNYSFERVLYVTGEEASSAA